MPKIVVLNDLHVSTKSRSQNRTLGQVVLEVLPEVMAFIWAKKPDKIIFLGDILQQRDNKSDILIMNDILSILEPYKENIIFTTGNHEARGMGIDAFSKILERRDFDNRVYGKEVVNDQYNICCGFQRHKKVV